MMIMALAKTDEVLTLKYKTNTAAMRNKTRLFRVYAGDENTPQLCGGLFHKPMSHKDPGTLNNQDHSMESIITPGFFDRGSTPDTNSCCF